MASFFDVVGNAALGGLESYGRTLEQEALAAKERSRMELANRNKIELENIKGQFKYGKLLAGKAADIEAARNKNALLMKRDKALESQKQKNRLELEKEKGKNKKAKSSKTNNRNDSLDKAMAAYDKKHSEISQEFLKSSYGDFVPEGFTLGDNKTYINNKTGKAYGADFIARLIATSVLGPRPEYEAKVNKPGKKVNKPGKKIETPAQAQAPAQVAPEIEGLVWQQADDNEPVSPKLSGSVLQQTVKPSDWDVDY